MCLMEGDIGEVAQLVRALAVQCQRDRFDSCSFHIFFYISLIIGLNGYLIKILR